MVKRYVTCGDGKKVPLGVYVSAWRVVRDAKPDLMFNRSLCERWPASAGEILAQYRAGMVDRINRHMPPWYGKGRKWGDSWQTETRRAARQLNTPRLAIHWLPIWLKDRFSHRLGENVFA